MSSCGLDRYVEGFLDGQAVAYCEMVKRGVRLAGQMDVHSADGERLRSVVEREGCFVRIVSVDPERVGLWIYAEKPVGWLIDAFYGADPIPQELAAWGMGKLFGYGDRNVLDFLMLMSTSD